MTLPLNTVRERVDRASEAEILRMLTAVLLWEENPLVIPSLKPEAQGLINGILFSEDENRKGAVERARKFLHRHSDKAAARGGY